jgi:histidine triad (HIT) family protein
MSVADPAAAGPLAAGPAGPAESCLFCGIVAGTIPSRQVYSDAHAVAFLDITPWHRGHTLVVPRRHVPDFASGAAALTEIAPAVDAVARLLQHRLAADGLNLLSSAGAVAGQTVFHLHVHVIPRYADEPGLERMENPGSAPEGELESVYRSIKAGA